ncbi:MAG TPA: electron transfer flavoprotein subunit beta/FixA family protein [bacterium]
MNILVPVKSVIDVELNIRVKDGKVAEDGMNYILSKWDENAVEAALQLKEKVGAGEVTVISIGPDRAGEALRKALAMGADKAIHVNDPATEGSDSFAIARILAAAAKKGNYDLIITGKQAQDTDMGATGAITAALLDWPAVVNVQAIASAEGKKMTVHRLGHAGKEVIDLALPAVITANDSLNEPRLASLRGIMQAKKKPFEAVKLADLGVNPGDVGSAGARTQLAEVTPPAGRAAGKKFDGDPVEITKQVVDLLANEAKIFA